MTGVAAGALSAESLALTDNLVQLVSRQHELGHRGHQGFEHVHIHADRPIARAPLRTLGHPPPHWPVPCLHW